MPMWARISPCGHPKETFLASPLEMGVEISQVTSFAKCTGAKHLRATASATWLQNCCWCSSMSVREVGCIYDTELDIATHLLSVAQIIPQVNVAALLQLQRSFRKWKRNVQCFPEDCSSEVSEVEVVKGYVSWLSGVFLKVMMWKPTGYLFLLLS